MENNLKPEEIIDPLSKERIIDWDSIKIKDTDIRLYYKFLDNKKEYGFYFYCSKACIWDSETEEILGCKCVYHGVAYWDGIRHFYIGDHQTDNYGYLYYVHLGNLITAIKELEKLENKYCKDA